MSIQEPWLKHIVYDLYKTELCLNTKIFISLFINRMQEIVNILQKAHIKHLNSLRFICKHVIDVTYRKHQIH